MCFPQDFMRLWYGGRGGQALILFSEEHVLTCKCAGVPEGSDLGVRQASEQRDDRVHHVLVVDDAVLALPHQHADELAEAGLELLPLRPSHGQGVVAAVLEKAQEKASGCSGCKLDLF